MKNNEMKKKMYKNTENTFCERLTLVSNKHSITYFLSI